MQKDFVEEIVPNDVFENAIRKFGIVNACEWFGHSSDSEFTKETVAVLNARLQAENNKMIPKSIVKEFKVLDFKK